MFRHLAIPSFFALAFALGACSSSSSQDSESTTNPESATSGQGALTPSSNTMSFFVSSQANTGNLGGLAGADKICTDLATAVGSEGKTWRAYLSVDDDGTGKPVNAKDRIGNGPWVNSKGVTVATDLTALHAIPHGDADLFLNEKGEKNPGQWAGSPTPVQHDIMTGSNPDGTLQAGKTCANWTSDSATLTEQPIVGHSDGMGPMMNTMPPYNSWNSSHAAMDCSPAGLAARGSAGRIYCFAQ
ncbi:MAG TPA: hypothetical protein VG963_00595 [Polyangiaceae bacterium]|nr:hypothetical protein [Polyangiaceae bacterium]